MPQAVQSRLYAAAALHGSSLRRYVKPFSGPTSWFRRKVTSRVLSPSIYSMDIAWAMPSKRPRLRRARQVESRPKSSCGKPESPPEVGIPEVVTRPPFASAAPHYETGLPSINANNQAPRQQRVSHRSRIQRRPPWAADRPALLHTGVDWRARLARQPSREPGRGRFGCPGPSDRHTGPGWIARPDLAPACVPRGVDDEQPMGRYFR
jgi:hypothetical protein